MSYPGVAAGISSFRRVYLPQRGTQHNLVGTEAAVVDRKSGLMLTKSIDGAHFTRTVTRSSALTTGRVGVRFTSAATALVVQNGEDRND